MKKENRIKKNLEIASIVNKRNKVFSQDFIVYYQTTNSNKVRIAISVSKKYGHAFERNLAKRRVRSIMRPYIGTMSNIDMVIVVKINSKNQMYETLNKELQFLMKLLNKKKEGKNEK